MAKRKRHKKISPLQDMMAKMRADENFKKSKVVINPQGEVKMSEVITTLLEPYRDMATTLAAYQNLVAVACIAWNTANMPKGEYAQKIGEAISALPGMDGETRVDMMNFMMELIQRKELLFPDNKRIIVNFKVTETRNNYHIAIASTLESPKGLPDEKL